jgi:hypothetical protein
MIKHALAVALLGIGIGFTDHAPVHAAPSPSGIAASSIRMADDTVVKVGCLDEILIVNQVVALFDILSDEEYECHKRSDADYHDRRAYDERKYPTYKDGGYAQPKDLKEAR